MRSRLTPVTRSFILFIFAPLIHRRYNRSPAGKQAIAAADQEKQVEDRLLNAGLIARQHCRYRTLVHPPPEPPHDPSPAERRVLEHRRQARRQLEQEALHSQQIEKEHEWGESCSSLLCVRVWSLTVIDEQRIPNEAKPGQRGVLSAGSRA